MKIRAGYEISYDCPQPTPMILTLSVHPSRVPDLLTWDRMRFDPPIPANTYHDSFGNFCHVIRAPAGRLTMSTDFLVQDKGEPDAVAPQAEQHALGDLPVEVLIYLLGSRYCETDRLSDTAWSLFGQVPKGWPLVKAICDYVHDRITFGYQHASPTKTAWDAHTERRGVCRDFAHLAVTLCRCMNVPARYCTGYLGDIGVPLDPCADGFQRLVRSLSRRPLVHVRRPPQQAAHRPHPDGARARRHRRRDRDLVRPVHARGLQGDHRGGHLGCARDDLTALELRWARPCGGKPAESSPFLASQGIAMLHRRGRYVTQPRDFGAVSGRSTTASQDRKNPLKSKGLRRSPGAGAGPRV